MQVFQLCYTDGSPTLGCPAILRSDYGTENATLATIHVTFRLQHVDSLAGEKSFIHIIMYGSICTCHLLNTFEVIASNHFGVAVCRRQF